MTAENELTIDEYLGNCAPKEQAAEENLGTRMCELLAGPLGDTNCEGGWDALHQMCDVTTSTTYTRHQLDWAYRQLAGH